MLADPRTVALLHQRTRHIRNICIVAHVDHGKTTLSDYLLCSNGIISPKLAGKVRFLDSRPDEQDRGITMKSSSIALLFNDKRSLTDPQQPQSPPPTASNGAPPSQPNGTASTSTTSSSSPPPSSSSSSSSSNLYLINLIDSPGHVDFSSEVSTAVRVSDGCLVLVDVLEGICVQTHAVLRQAWDEGVKPILILNKIDRLFVEVEMTPMEAYQHMMKIIEQINAITSTFITADAMEKAANSETDQVHAATASASAVAAESSSTPSSSTSPSNYEVDIEDSEQWTFEPERGNVVFASAHHQWAFTIPQFAEIIAKKMLKAENATAGGDDNKEVDQTKLRAMSKHLQRALWGDFYFHPKDKKVSKKPPKAGAQPMFVDMIMEQIHRMYTQLTPKHAHAQGNKVDVATLKTIIAKLELKIHDREINSKGGEPYSWLSLVMSRWLPIPAAVLGTVVDHLPDPITAQSTRIDKLWPGAAVSVSNPTSSLVEAVRRCDPAHEQILIYVSKMVDMGDMIRKMKASMIARAHADNLRGTGGATTVPGSSRSTYHRGRLNATAATAVGSSASAAAVPEQQPEPGAASPASEPSTEPELSASSSPTAISPSTSPPAAAPASSTDDDSDSARFVGFARIWCGTLRATPLDAAPKRLHIFGPKYDPADPDTHELHSHTLVWNDPAATEQDRSITNSIALYLLMGTDIQQIDRIPAGNVFAIGGLSSLILNTATISTDARCIPFRNMQYQSAPIVRVAIETEHVGDMKHLVRGLKLLNQADANVQVRLLESGEHVIVASGELHLDRCLRDLRDRFCPEGVKLRVSPPLISFRETVVEDFTIEATKKSTTKIKKKTKEERKKEEMEDEEVIDMERKAKIDRKLKEEMAAAKTAAAVGKITLNDDGVASSSSASAEPIRDSAASVRSSSDMDHSSLPGGSGSASDPTGTATGGGGAGGVGVGATGGTAGSSSSIPAFLASVTGSGKPQRFKYCIEESIPGSRSVTVWIRALPLPLEVTQELEKNVAVIKGMQLRHNEEKRRRKEAAKAAAEARAQQQQQQQQQQQHEQATSSEPGVSETNDGDDRPSTGQPIVPLPSPSPAPPSMDDESGTGPAADTSLADISRLVSAIRKHFSDASRKHVFYRTDTDRIWAFGPRGVGSNILINRVEEFAHLTSIIPRELWDKHPQEHTHALPSGTPTAADDASTMSEAVRGGENTNTLRESLFLSLSNALLSGFQLACSAGPLCEEPLMGVAFTLEHIEWSGAWEAASASGSVPLSGPASPPSSGQVLSLMKSACRSAFNARARRLMEAFFHVELQCAMNALGELDAVLHQRRGRILSNDLREGTNTFHIHAYLPVVESFGFARDVRKKTGGEASPQLIFSHWETLQQDPFFVPRSEEELELHGTQVGADLPNLARQLIDDVRRRKGLPVEKKVVQHAEKQRTIKR